LRRERAGFRTVRFGMSSPIARGRFPAPGGSCLPPV
jgi:hypothetical protein